MVKSIHAPLASAPIALQYEVWRSQAGVMISFNHIERDLARGDPTGWRENAGSLFFEIESSLYQLAQMPPDALEAFFDQGLLAVEFGEFGPLGEHWARNRASAS